MDCHLVDIHCAKPNDGTTTFAYFWTEGDFKQITYIVKLREKDEKYIGCFNSMV